MVRSTASSDSTLDLRHGPRRGATSDDRGDLLARLTDEHRALEARLAELGRHLGLTAAEKDEYRQLKQRKLLIKDRLRALAGVDAP